MRPECRDSDGRGVNREKEGRTRNTKSARTTKAEERDRMLSMQPVRTLKPHACCQLLYMKMVVGLPPLK